MTRPTPEQVDAAEELAALVVVALDLGLEAWRATDSRHRFVDAVAAVGWLRELAAEVVALRNELAEAKERASSEWMPALERERAARETAERERDLMEACDCIPCGFSSKVCHKCGRRGVVGERSLLDEIKRGNAAEAAARYRQERDEARRAVFAITYASGGEVVVPESFFEIDLSAEREDDPIQRTITFRVALTENPQ